MCAAKPVKFFTFYDLETYGLDPKSDRIAQFAAIRTDSDFNILEKTVIYCLPQQDYIPSVESMLLTGITPEDTETTYRKQAFRESEFISRVIGFLSRPDNCVLGYNNVKFDDEYLRFTAFRNFYDSYSFNTNSSNNSTRWDLVYLVRTCFALSPEGINWPEDTDGAGVSMRLEHMSKANNLVHSHAHDALSDVEATIQLAKLIRDSKPKLFNYYFNLRTKQSIEEAFYDQITGTFKKSPLVHIDTCYGMESMNAAVVLPVYLKNEKGAFIYGWRLNQDLSPLFKLAGQPDSINPAEYDLRQLGLVKINIARCPALSEYSVIAKRSARAERLNISLQQVAANMEYLADHQNLSAVLDLFVEFEKNRYSSETQTEEQDPEHMLYSLFNLSAEDRRNKNVIHERETKDPFVFDEIRFSSSTLRRLLFRYKARNFSQYLNSRELEKWNSHLISFLNGETPRLQEEIAEAIGKYAGDLEKLKKLLSIINYYSREGLEVADQECIDELTETIVKLEEKIKSQQNGGGGEGDVKNTGAVSAK